MDNVLTVTKIGFKIWLSSKFVKWLLIYIKNVYHYRNIAGSPALPIIGHLLKTGNDGPSMLKAISEMSNDFIDRPVFKFWRAWACLLIGSHPEVQKKIQDELDDIFGDSDRHVTNEDLGKMKYLEMVIKETMRLFPSVPYYGREVSQDFKIENTTVRAGSTAYILSYMIHRDPKYYPNPSKFDPDRFLPENTKERHPYAYVPFSAGRRNCVGQRFAIMEEKVLLAKLLHNYELEPLIDIEVILPDVGLVLKPQQGVPVVLKSRR